MEGNQVPAGVFTGYASADIFLATRKKMGGRWVVHIDMSISQLVLGVDAPPVGVEQDDNRVVVESRCKEFANYIDGNQHWGSPSLMLWCPQDVIEFDPIEEINRQLPFGIQAGYLKVPRNSRTSIRILDGQHRIKGFHLWVAKKNQELSKAKEHLARARDLQDQAGINEAKHRVKLAEEALERTEREHIGVDIVEVNTAKEAKQIFADIANNAKGMNKSLTTGFDTTKIVNRVTQKLVNEKPHPMLEERVEWHKDRLSGNNPNVLAAKTVADIVRTTYVGVLGRVSKVQEQGDEVAVYNNAKAFFDALEAAFPELLSTSPLELRESSLISSGTMLRVLAGAWFDLTRTTDEAGKSVSARMTHGEVTEFFKTLQPHMKAPVVLGNAWLRTGFFPQVLDANSQGVMAPSSRTQDLKGLSELIRDWGLGIKPTPFN